MQWRRKSSIYILFIFLFCLTSCDYFRNLFTPIPENSCSLYGRIEDRELGIGLPHVKVECGNVSGWTDKEGIYKLDYINLGKATTKKEKIIITAPYYALVIEEIQLVQGPKEYNKDLSSARSGTLIDASEVKHFTQWQKEKSPYFIPNMLYILNVLTINPGVTLLFGKEAGLFIEGRGRINANGTSSQPIRFTSLAKEKGSWVGIKLRDAEPCYFSHCLIEYASIGVDCSNQRSLCQIGYSKVCLNKKYGLYYFNSRKIILTTTKIYQNGRDGLKLQNCASDLGDNYVQIRKNSFEKNSENGITSINSACLLQSNKISYNLKNGVNFSYTTLIKDIIIDDNDIVGNAEYAVGGNLPEGIKVNNCYIADNLGRKGVATAGNTPDKTQCAPGIEVINPK
jgi:hypothetical protein